VLHDLERTWRILPRSLFAHVYGRRGKLGPAPSRKGSSVALYDELGGDAALDAALDAFYVKILADPRVNGSFDGVDMVRLKGHAKAFLTMAFGGPEANITAAMEIAEGGRSAVLAR